MSRLTDFLLEARDLVKTFSEVTVLRGVSLDISGGQVHAVMGENGAGKSTLMKILAGFYRPDSGYLKLAGKRILFKSPHEALKNGIAMIHQELLPFPNMTVAENICMGIEPVVGVHGWIDQKEMERRAFCCLRRLGCSLSPKKQMGGLTVAEMQLVELAKALNRQVKMIIMDEPTSALSWREVEALYRIIQELRNAGIALVYISHRMEEVFKLADFITVLRDGEKVISKPMRDLDAPQLIRYMVGRDFQPTAIKEIPKQSEVLLSVRRFSKAGKFKNIHLEVKRGEILGIAGLMGAGRTDLAHAICGLSPSDEGEVQVKGCPVAIRNPRDAFALGIALVVEDRKRHGLVMQMSVVHNITLKNLDRFCRFSWIMQRRERQAARGFEEQLNIKCDSLDQKMGNLSGGNQQKSMLAKALMSDPMLLILDEPTRGIDVAAKQEIHTLIRQLAGEGRGVMLISSEMTELLTLSHRIIVMREGQISGEINPEITSQDELLRLCMPMEASNIDSDGLERHTL